MYFIEIINVRNPDLVTTTTTSTTTTTPIDYGFTELSFDRKIFFNNKLNNDIKLFNNVIFNKTNLNNINLIQSEQSKFKFVYSYIILNKINENIDINLINEYSKKIFNTSLYEPNLLEFKVDDHYFYEVNDIKPNFCFKAESEDNNTVFINMIKDDECNKMDESTDILIINQIKLEYEIIDDEIVYKSFVIIK